MSPCSAADEPHPPGRRIVDLATHGGMTKQSMHELVGHLERHSYLKRVPDPADVRLRLARLTERGRRPPADPPWGGCQPKPSPERRHSMPKE